jgi:excisionase family DNA binding protein
MNEEKEFYTVYEMAAQMNVAPPTIYRWILDGCKSQKQHVGRRVRTVLTMDDVNEFLLSNPELQ